MIKGIGTDIVEVERIAKSIARDHGFKELVFSSSEIGVCEQKGMPAYAGKFAAKEAFLKALGTGWVGDLALHEIEIENNALGKPFLTLSGKTRELLKDLEQVQIHLSISHTQTYATAVVILESI